LNAEKEEEDINSYSIPYSDSHDRGSVRYGSCMA